MALTTRLQVIANAHLQSALDLVTAEAKLAKQWAVDLATGTGADQADKVFSDQRTLTASATEDLDLAGSLVDALGATITFARIKALIIRAASGNTNNVVIGAAGANPWTGPLGGTTPTITLRPGGLVCLIAPDATAWAVTAGTGDLLKVANSAGSTSVTYDIVIIGASA